MSITKQNGGTIIKFDSTGHEIDTASAGKTIRLKTNSIPRITISDDFIDAAANKIKTHNLLLGYNTTVSSATIATLTKDSPHLQYYTGTIAQVVRMPDVTTLVLGQQWRIVNITNKNTQVQSFNGTQIRTLVPADQGRTYTCISISDNSDNGWDING